MKLTFGNRFIFEGNYKFKKDGKIEIANNISEILFDTENACTVTSVFRSIIKQELNRVHRYVIDGNKLVLIFTLPDTFIEKQLVFEHYQDI